MVRLLKAAHRLATASRDSSEVDANGVLFNKKLRTKLESRPKKRLVLRDPAPTKGVNDSVREEPPPSLPPCMDASPAKAGKKAELRYPKVTIVATSTAMKPETPKNSSDLRAKNTHAPKDPLLVVAAAPSPAREQLVLDYQRSPRGDDGVSRKNNKSRTTPKPVKRKIRKRKTKGSIAIVRGNLDLQPVHGDHVGQEVVFIPTKKDLKQAKRTEKYIRKQKTRDAKTRLRVGKLIAESKQLSEKKVQIQRVSTVSTDVKDTAPTSEKKQEPPTLRKGLPPRAPTVKKTLSPLVMTRPRPVVSEKTATKQTQPPQSPTNDQSVPGYGPSAPLRKARPSLIPRTGKDALASPKSSPAPGRPVEASRKTPRQLELKYADGVGRKATPGSASPNSPKSKRQPAAGLGLAVSLSSTTGAESKSAELISKAKDHSKSSLDSFVLELVPISLSGLTAKQTRSSSTTNIEAVLELQDASRPTFNKSSAVASLPLQFSGRSSTLTPTLVSWTNDETSAYSFCVVLRNTSTPSDGTSHEEAVCNFTVSLRSVPSGELIPVGMATVVFDGVTEMVEDTVILPIRLPSLAPTASKGFLGRQRRRRERKLGKVSFEVAPFAVLKARIRAARAGSMEVAHHQHPENGNEVCGAPSPSISSRVPPSPVDSVKIQRQQPTTATSTTQAESKPATPTKILIEKSDSSVTKEEGSVQSKTISTVHPKESMKFLLGEDSPCSPLSHAPSLLSKLANAMTSKQGQNVDENTDLPCASNIDSEQRESVLTKTSDKESGLRVMASLSQQAREPITNDSLKPQVSRADEEVPEPIVEVSGEAEGYDSPFCTKDDFASFGAFFGTQGNDSEPPAPQDGEVVVHASNFEPRVTQTPLESVYQWMVCADAGCFRGSQSVNADEPHATYMQSKGLEECAPGMVNDAVPKPEMDSLSSQPEKGEERNDCEEAEAVLVDVAVSTSLESEVLICAAATSISDRIATVASEPNLGLGESLLAVGDSRQNDDSVADNRKEEECLQMIRDEDNESSALPDSGTADMDAGDTGAFILPLRSTSTALVKNVEQTEIVESTLETAKEGKHATHHQVELPSINRTQPAEDTPDSSSNFESIEVTLSDVESDHLNRSESIVVMDSFARACSRDGTVEVEQLGTGTQTMASYSSEVSSRRSSDERDDDGVQLSNPIYTILFAAEVLGIVGNDSDDDSESTDSEWTSDSDSEADLPIAYTVSTYASRSATTASELSRSTYSGSTYQSALTSVVSAEEVEAATRNIIRIANKLGMEVDELIDKMEAGEDIEKLLLSKFTQAQQQKEGTLP